MKFSSVIGQAGSIQLPEFSGTRVQMMPVVLGDPRSVPLSDDWRQTFADLCALHPLHDGEVGYLTVDERIVTGGQSQRRGTTAIPKTRWASCPRVRSFRVGAKWMPSLSRTRDGAGDSGSMSEARWVEDGELKVDHFARPRVGVWMRVGSLYARTYAAQDWWQTTTITEILEDTGDTVRFKTGNSEYIWRE